MVLQQQIPRRAPITVDNEQAEGSHNGWAWINGNVLLDTESRHCNAHLQDLCIMCIKRPACKSEFEESAFTAGDWKAGDLTAIDGHDHQMSRAT